MNRNLCLKEIRRNAAGLIIWMVIISALIVVTMSVYPTFLANHSKVMGMLTLVPKELLQFKGISSLDDLTSVLGFYASNNAILMLLLGSIYSIVLSSGMLLKEEYNKTAEYLLTRPLTRGEVFFSKLAVSGINIFFLNLFTGLAGFISIWIVKTAAFSVKAFLCLSVYTLLLNILFGATGFLLSTLVRRPRPITAFSIGLVLILYFIYTISKIAENVEFLGYLSPFRFVDTNVITAPYALNALNLVYFTGFSLLMLILSYQLYRRRDIYT